MLISIRDSTLSCVANMDNTLPKALHYYDDNWRRLLKEATSTFSFTVDKTGLEAERYLTEQNYLSFVHEGRDYLFNIMRVVENSEKRNITVYAENLNLELLNDTKQGIDVTTSQNILWYLNNDNITNGAGLTVGINEVSDQVRKIKIESEQTALARLLSIATNFDAEIEFVTELNSDGTLRSLILNIHKKYDGVSQGVGAYRNDVTLYYGKNVDGITRTTDKTELYNAITPAGKDGTSVKDLERTILDNDGNVKYFTKKGSYAIYAPQSMALYPSKVIGAYNGYIHKFHSLDGISDINTLFSLSVNELDKHILPAISYEVFGYYNLNIGDTVMIQDDSYNPMLIIQARVAEQSICFSDPTKNKIIFGNILALESRVSQDLTGRLKELVDQVTPYRFEIISDNGLTFKNSTGSTTLTARVYKGSNIDEVSVDSFEWLIDGVSFGGTSKSQLVNASQVTGTAVVRYNAKIGDTVIGGIEVTLQDVSDGTDGVSPTVTINPDTSLTIVDAQGTRTTPVLKGSDGVPGKDGVGIESTVITYGLSASDSVQPTNWTTTVPNLVKGQYLWTKTVWSYDDSTSETGYTKTYIAKDGNSGTDGLPGKDGVGIKTTAITYAKSTNGNTAPTSGWITSVPIAVAGDYIWTKTVWTYTDNTTETGYSVGKIGNTGPKGDKGEDGIAGKDGKGITGTVITYGLSTSETTQPSTWTSSVPSLVKGQYLWTKTVWTYTDNSSETGYSVTYISKDGNNGTNGIAGKDGVGIKTTTITYASHTNGTTAPTTGYTTAVPSVPAGQFLWTKTVWTYTDNSTEAGYSVARMGVKGDKGDQGVPGVKGSNGTSGIIVSSVAPTSPQNGQLWQDTSTTPQLVKKWTGTSWVIWEFYAQNLKSDSLETVSSKIGNIYNDFTLEDGTTGSLHIGNSEYRIDSQVLKDNFLFKENIFFNPDGLNFNFEGDTASNTGHGNYTKSGSEFYIQNLQSRASYTVSGISMGNELAGYRIQIHDATHKMNFVSENGQGFDFTGPVSFNGVPVESDWIAMPKGRYKFAYSRVAISFDVTGAGETFVNIGTLPQGVRPPFDRWFFAATTGTTTADDRHVMVRASDGAVVLWSPKSGTRYQSEISFTL